MSRKNRGSTIKSGEVTIVHTVAKASRNLFLLGMDFATKTQNSHRKDWIVELLEFQSSLMGVDLLHFSLLCNHIHQVLRSRPDVVKHWDNHEVARRWLNLCPKSKKMKVGDTLERVPIPPKETQIEALAKDEKKIAELRERLSSISWWMRLLCQKVAQRANLEDGGSLGPFWKGRFHSTVIDDPSYLLGCGFYVDLNAFMAGLACGIDDYAYTSAKFRLESLKTTQRFKEDQESHKAGSIKQMESSTHVLIVSNPEDPGPEPPVPEPAVPERSASHPSVAASIPKISRGEFLSVVKIETLSSDPQLHTQGYRCSDKGFLDYSDKEYLEALEWCIRNKITYPEPELPTEVPECIKNHPLGPEMVIRQAREFGQMYRHRTGKKDDLKRQPEATGGTTSSMA